jgi:hypothetical protein
MIYKHSFRLLLALLFIFIVFWSFNHVNPWISILLGFGGLTFLANVIYKQNNK